MKTESGGGGKRNINRRAALFACAMAGLLGGAAISPVRGEAEALPARTFAHPDRIRYDGQCLTIDGRDVFIYSGAFHYFRCPKPLWRDRFQKIKDAGFNAVETYAAWNWHERAQPAGLDDYSKMDLTDLEDWLQLAESFGFYIIVRPGPYICAEWDTGGYPQWLLTKRPASVPAGQAWLRGDDPTYLAWCKHWYDAVCPVIARHQVTRKAPGQPGVILVQLENEYDYAGFSDDVKRNQVRALGRAALANGIDVPLFTCWTHCVRGQSDPLLRQVFDSCNFYPRWGVDGIASDIAKLGREQPDAPRMTTELQGGWFSRVGGQLSDEQDGLTAAQINNLTLFAIQNGDTVLNYYMLFGGSNPGDWGARDMTTTYDYNAPIREWGGVGDRYQRVWALGHLLREHGARLARSKVVPCTVTGTPSDVSVVLRQAADGGRYFFIRTSQHAASRTGTARVKATAGDPTELAIAYTLEPFGAKVLYLPAGVNEPAAGEWLPKPAPEVARPAKVPAPVKLLMARQQADSGPAHWLALRPGETLAEAGLYDSRFIYYRAETDSATKTNLLVEHAPGDAVLAAVDGRGATGVNTRGGLTTVALPPGPHRLLLLYENRGHANGGLDMERAAGIQHAEVSARPLGGGRPITGWRMHEVPEATNRPEVQPDFNVDTWRTVNADELDANQLRAGRTAVFRALVPVSTAELRSGGLNLQFGRIDDHGWVYVNGQFVGEATDWARAYKFDVTAQLHAGTNCVAVIVQNTDGAGGLGQPGLGQNSDGAPLSLTACGSPAGVEAQWFAPGFDDQSWTATTVGSTATNGASALLTWYRLAFELPAPQPGEWVPWRLHLAAAGNGFLYLNGHALGRYWQVGPQHDFFLPECWLNFGPGQRNVVTLSLRPDGRGTAIEAAAVEPYASFAEVRPAGATPASHPQ
jgi:hypothetical protein